MKTAPRGGFGERGQKDLGQNSDMEEGLWGESSWKTELSAVLVGDRQRVKRRGPKEAHQISSEMRWRCRSNGKTKGKRPCRKVYGGRARVGLGTCKV